jgi:hypothetical protein
MQHGIALEQGPRLPQERTLLNNSHRAASAKGDSSLFIYVNTINRSAGSDLTRKEAESYYEHV